MKHNRYQKVGRATRRSCSALLLVLSLVGCGGYGEVSQATYDYSKALYSIANRRASDQLDGIAEQVATAEAEAHLSSREAGWLNDIIQDARREKWDLAAGAARRIMEDQVH